MKCPKCGYLGFEPVERCRNCGYDFSLTPGLKIPELPMRVGDADEAGPLDDLTLTAEPSTFGQPDADNDADTLDVQQRRPAWQLAPDLERPLGSPSAATAGTRRRPESAAELPLFGSPASDDLPLITRPSPPRPPLAVRRATPESPRVRSPQPRAPILDLGAAALDSRRTVFLQPQSDLEDWRAGEALGAEPAGVGARVAAVAIDLAILAAIDLLVVYFTIQICGLTAADVGILPKGPLISFFLVQNGGYLAVFTAGGQTLGKMAAGIRVVSARADGSIDLGRSIVRTLIWIALAVPAGLGFTTALFSRDRRGLHDRCAGTRVVRAAV